MAAGPAVTEAMRDYAQTLEAYTYTVRYAAGSARRCDKAKTDVQCYVDEVHADCVRLYDAFTTEEKGRVRCPPDRPFHVRMDAREA